MIKLLTVFALSFAIAACASGPGPVTPKTRVERQMIGLLQKFDRWDDNGDGYLIRSELKSAEKISGHSPAKIIAFYDGNADRKISLSEAQSGYARSAQAEQIIHEAR